MAAPERGMTATIKLLWNQPTSMEATSNACCSDIAESPKVPVISALSRPWALLAFLHALIQCLQLLALLLIHALGFDGVRVGEISAAFQIVRDLWAWNGCESSLG